MEVLPRALGDRNTPSGSLFGVSGRNSATLAQSGGATPSCALAYRRMAWATAAASSSSWRCIGIGASPLSAAKVALASSISQRASTGETISTWPSRKATGTMASSGFAREGNA